MICRTKWKINLMCTNIVSRIYCVQSGPQSNLSKFDEVLDLQTDNINKGSLYLKSKFFEKSRNLSFCVYFQCDVWPRVVTRRLVMSRDHGGWRQQQQQQRRREPGITVSLHPRDVTKYLYPAIIHCSVRTQQPCVIQYQCSLLPSELSAPPQHSNIQQKSDLLTPGLPHSHCTIHCTIHIVENLA